MLSEYLKKILEEVNAVSEIDIVRANSRLPKPRKGGQLIGKLSDESQKLWTLIGMKTEEAKAGL